MRVARLHLSPEDGAFPGIDRAIADAPGLRREALLEMEWLADGSHALPYRVSGGPAERLRAVLADHDEVRLADVVAAGDDHVAFVHVGQRQALAELLSIAETHALLTDRQRTALEAAHRLGFYETPRAVSYDDIADELDCAPTTANELLRRAEARIVGALLESST